MDMKYLLFCVVVLLTLTCSFCEDDGQVTDSKGSTSSPVKTSSTEHPVVTSNCTKLNETDDGAVGLYAKMIENRAMLMRGFYVLLAVTSIVVIYFGIKAYR